MNPNLMCGESKASIGVQSVRWIEGSCGLGVGRDRRYRLDWQARRADIVHTHQLNYIVI